MINYCTLHVLNVQVFKCVPRPVRGFGSTVESRESRPKKLAYARSAMPPFLLAIITISSSK